MPEDRTVPSPALASSRSAAPASIRRTEIDQMRGVDGEGAVGGLLAPRLDIVRPADAHVNAMCASSVVSRPRVRGIGRRSRDGRRPMSSLHSSARGAVGLAAAARAPSAGSSASTSFAGHCQAGAPERSRWLWRCIMGFDRSLACAARARPTASGVRWRSPRRALDHRPPPSAPSRQMAAQVDAIPAIGGRRTRHHRRSPAARAAARRRRLRTRGES